MSCAAFSMHEGCLTEPLDAFAMLPMAELEYTGITEKLDALEHRFVARVAAPKAAAAVA